MVLPNDTAMYDGGYVDWECEDYVFTDGDEDDDEHDS